MSKPQITSISIYRLVESTITLKYPDESKLTLSIPGTGFADDKVKEWDPINLLQKLFDLATPHLQDSQCLNDAWVNFKDNLSSKIRGASTSIDDTTKLSFAIDALKIISELITDIGNHRDTNNRLPMAADQIQEALGNISAAYASMTPL